MKAIQLLEQEQQAYTTLLKAKLSIIKFLTDHAQKIEELGVSVTTCGSTIDFDNPTREQVLEIIKAFPGDWEKGTYVETMYYRTTFEGQPLRIWNAPLLPSCQIIEEEVEVPAYTERRRRIECNTQLVGTVTGRLSSNETNIEEVITEAPIERLFRTNENCDGTCKE